MTSLTGLILGLCIVSSVFAGVFALGKIMSGMQKIASFGGEKLRLMLWSKVMGFFVEHRWFQAFGVVVIFMRSNSTWFMRRGHLKPKPVQPFAPISNIQPTILSSEDPAEGKPLYSDEFFDGVEPTEIQ
jgi:hypothetical protein